MEQYSHIDVTFLDFNFNFLYSYTLFFGDMLNDNSILIRTFVNKGFALNGYDHSSMISMAHQLKNYFRICWIRDQYQIFDPVVYFALSLFVTFHNILLFSLSVILQLSVPFLELWLPLVMGY